MQGSAERRVFNPGHLPQQTLRRQLISIAAAIVRRVYRWYPQQHGLARHGGALPDVSGAVGQQVVDVFHPPAVAVLVQRGSKGQFG